MHIHTKQRSNNNEEEYVYAHNCPYKGIEVCGKIDSKVIC